MQTQQEVDALLDQLAASGTLSESRFVETRIRARAARQGNLRIAQELARHGLQLSAGDAQELKASEYARAKDVWQRKFAAPPTDAAGRARQMRFLAARGFSSDIIRRLLRGADDE
ncbi:MAG: RecX family transcriptional regulator [Burkholderiaceae bacterium]|nr:RecX family transcriptional regulator [Burkholderiaceae bacterium]